MAHGPDPLGGGGADAPDRVRTGDGGGGLVSLAERRRRLRAFGIDPNAGRRAERERRDRRQARQAARKEVRADRVLRRREGSRPTVLFGGLDSGLFAAGPTLLGL